MVEVAYDHMQGGRFRHTAQFRRWRTDKPPRDCTFAQLEVVAPQELAEIFGRSGLERVWGTGTSRRVRIAISGPHRGGKIDLVEVCAAHPEYGARSPTTRSPTRARLLRSADEADYLEQLAHSVAAS